MIAAVEGLIAELRKVGLPISVSENIDAEGNKTRVFQKTGKEIK